MTTLEEPPKRVPRVSPLRPGILLRVVFYDAREFIVVLLLAWLTVSADFKTAQLPILGPTQKHEWMLAFSLVFTSVLLIWFAQAPSKKLATANSLAFLTVFQFTLVWPFFLKPIGLGLKQLKMTYPARLVAGPFQRLSSFKEERNLPPSRRSFYMDALKCYGYAYHLVEDHLQVHTDNSAHFRHCSLIYFTETALISGVRIGLEFDSNVAKDDLQIQSFAAPVLGETFKPEIEQEFRDIFEGIKPSGQFSEEQPCSLSWHRAPDRSTKAAAFLVHSPDPLPGCVRVNNLSAKAAAVRLVIDVDLVAGAFKLPQGPEYENLAKDYWEKRNVSPCEEYRFKLEIERIPAFPNATVADFKTTVNVREGIHYAETSRVNRIPAPSPSRLMKERAIRTRSLVQSIDSTGKTGPGEPINYIEWAVRPSL